MPKQFEDRKNARRATNPVPKIPNSVLERSRLGRPWSDCANDSIEQFNEFSSAFPREYGWRFKTKEALDVEIQRAASADASPATINALYWTDTLKNLEAYTVMSVWRTAELLRSAARSLSDGETIIAGIVARAALEGVVQFLDVSRKVSSTLQDLQGVDFQGQPVASKELEELILGSVFASKLPEAEKEFNPTNIVTILQRVAKIPGQSELLQRYSVLCEITHPNFLGRSVYVLEIEMKDRTGDELRVLSQKHGPISEELIDLSLWAIWWSAATQVSSARLMQASIGALVGKLQDRVH